MRRAADVPALADAWTDGRLSGGQVKAIVANVGDDTADLFAEHTRVMQLWRSRAEALLDEDEPREPERALHASENFAGQTELKGSFGADAGAATRTALRTAETMDDEATGTRTPAERRADALPDICRFFLDHQDTIGDGRRHRPHLNVLVDLEDVVGNAGGASAILDDGRSTRTAPPALFTALVLRDGRCRLVSGCDRGPAWCDAHHVVPWEDGGDTAVDNMVLGCSRHHHLLHRQRWRQSLARDGTLTIETIDGRTWTTYARGTIPMALPDAG